jgi:hypothetical protein
MAITIEYLTIDDVSIGTTEYSIAFNANYAAGSGKTDDGIYQLWVDDRGNMTKTEEYQIRIYELVLAADAANESVVFHATIKGDQNSVFVTPTLMLGNSWDMTIKKLAGTDRAFSARISRVS